MRLTLLALGSRGDVQPFVALGTELQRRGHAVRLAAAEDYAVLAVEARLAFAPVGGLIREQMDFDLTRQALDSARGALPLGFARRFGRHVEPLVERIGAGCAAAALRQTIENPRFRHRSAELSRLLAAEDGAGQAVELLEAFHEQSKI